MALKTLAKSQERVLKEMYSSYTEYWETLISVVPEYKTVLEKESKLRICSIRPRQPACGPAV